MKKPKITPDEKITAPPAITKKPTTVSTQLICGRKCLRLIALSASTERPAIHQNGVPRVVAQRAIQLRGSIPGGDQFMWLERNMASGISRKAPGKLSRVMP